MDFLIAILYATFQVLLTKGSLLFLSTCEIRRMCKISKQVESVAVAFNVLKERNTLFSNIAAKLMEATKET